MKKAALFLFITIGVLVQSCKKDENSSVSEGPLLINAVSNDRIAASENTTIFPVTSYGLQTGERSLFSRDISSEYNVELLAQLNSPVFEGKTLQATHISFEGNFAYISYNSAGSLYLGAIDVVNVSNSSAPVIVQSAIIRNVDISALLVNEGKLYFVGARDVDAFSGIVSPAFVGSVSLSNGLLTQSIILRELGGFVANSVLVNESSLYVSSGNTSGGVYILDPNTLNIKENLSYNGVKNIQFNSNSWMILEGAYTGSSSQSITRFNTSNGQYLNSVSLSPGINPDAKSNFRIYNENAIVANGYNGVTYYNVQNGNLIDRVGLPDSMPEYDSLDIYTNAVTVNDNYVYAANGAAGLLISQIDAGGSQFDILGKADIDGSVNYVESSGGFIFAAAGTGGLKILKLVPKETTNPGPDCASRPNMQSNGNGNYIVNSNESQYYQSPGNNGQTQLGSLIVNSNGLFDFCGRIRMKNNTNVDGIFYIRGDVEIKRDLTINSNGKLVIEGSVVIDGNLNFNGTIEFAAASSFQVKGNINKNSGAQVINAQLNNGPTIIP